MRDFAREFYKSTRWRRAREAYLKEHRYICEVCGGVADTVHHIEHLNVTNINDPDVTLNENNLMAVCRDCHAKIHSKVERRFVLDENGDIIVLPDKK